MKNIGIGLAFLVAIAVHSPIANAAPMLSFIIDGDTFSQPFSITNSSTAGENVVRFQLDLSALNLAYDTVDLGPPGNGTAGVPFTPVGGTDALTGLVGPVVIADGSKLLDIFFNNFQPGETFSWDIDVDGDAASGGNPISVFGNDLIGAIALIDFSDGQRLTGILQAVPGNSDASQFTVTGITPTPVVPEPASLAIWSLVSATGAVVGWRRRKQQARKNA